MNRVFYVLVMIAFLIAGFKFFTAPPAVPLVESHRDELVAAVEASPDRSADAIVARLTAGLDRIAGKSSKIADGAALADRIELRGDLSEPLEDALRAELRDQARIEGAAATRALSEVGGFAFGDDAPAGMTEEVRGSLEKVVDALDSSQPREVATALVSQVVSRAGAEGIDAIERHGAVAGTLRVALTERLAEDHRITGERAVDALTSLGGFAFGEKTAMQTFSDSLFDMAEIAVMNVVLPLVGAMAFFLGLMKVAEEAGAMRVIAKLLRPVMVLLFPDVPPTHPAMSAMILNMSANALGLGNAATPFGIRAMEELDKLNPVKGTATNAMCLFLAINTSSVTLLPTGVIAIREALGSEMSAGILPTTLAATIVSTSVAILAAKLYQRLTPAPEPTDAETVAAVEAEVASASDDDDDSYPLWVSLVAIGALLGLVPLSLMYGELIGIWVVPLLVVGFLTFGVVRGVAVYETFVAGAKEGWEVAVRIIPFLVTILAMVGMLRGSGAIDDFVGLVGGFTQMVGMPAEALPMALLRPLSGSGAYGLMMALMTEHGPDSYTGFLVSTLQGSTETTFYVIAVYFGAVQVQRVRHGLAAALTADAAGIAGAVAATTLFFTLNGLW